MHVTCPSCKFGGTVRDDQIPAGGREVYCPNCNTKFRIKKNPPSPAASRQAREETSAARAGQSEYLSISCPACGFTGKLKRAGLTSGQQKRVVCPSCKQPFTFTPSDPKPLSDEDPLPGDPTADPPLTCPGCGSDLQHPLPVCPSCGRILTGTKIYCPSCKSPNVGISENSRDNGGPQWETVLFRPVSVTGGKPYTIHIPLSCRDCGNAWMIQSALDQTSDEPADLGPQEG